MPNLYFGTKGGYPPGNVSDIYIAVRLGSPQMERTIEAACHFFGPHSIQANIALHT